MNKKIHLSYGLLAGIIVIVMLLTAFAVSYFASCAAETVTHLQKSHPELALTR